MSDDQYTFAANAKPMPLRSSLTSHPERWLAAIVESSDDAIIGESLDGTITTWNQGATRIFGYSAEEAIGKPISYLVWPGKEEQIQDLLERVRLGHRVDHFETLRKHKNGRKLLVSLSLSPIIDSNGTIIGIAKIARDITDRVAMEQSLSARTDQVRKLTESAAQARAQALAERRFRELIENAPDGILQVNEQGTILIANRTAEILFGYTRPELVGANVDLLVPHGLRPAHRSHRIAFTKAQVSRPMGIGKNLFARRKDGTEFPVEISLSPTTFDRELTITAVIRDITERRRTEEQVHTLQQRYMAELQAGRQEADRLNQLKSEFLAGISHELRTPLHTIIGFSDLLHEELDGALNDAQRSFVQHIQRDSEHLLRLINDLLDLSRIEAGGLNIRTEPLYVDTAIADAVAEIAPQALIKSVVVRAEPQNGTRVLADPIRLRQIFSNLLSNAVRFTSAGGLITVGAALENGFVRISVTDTGVGIPLDQQPMVFDKFFQCAYNNGGAGLGLAICKQLVELQGGKIGINSEQGKGSEFYFTLHTA